MRAYIQPILTAAWLFPFVAAVITLPYMLFQYRRYGAILLMRTTILYSFVLYLMCAYFLTMLPLPSREEVASLTTPYLQLEPFKDVVTWIQKSGFNPAQPATWKRLLINRDLFVMLANIVMTIPFGMYLRYYFGMSLRKTVLLSLCLSLVFELTQLSALFGIYPRPYRLCETDDLITNTLGGLIGYLLAGPLAKVLPDRAQMDAIAYRRGTHVSVTRRITAALVDWILVGFVLLVLCAASQPLNQFLRENADMFVWLGVFLALYIAAVLLYFVVGVWLQRGLTVGKRLTHLRLTDDRDGSRPKLWQCAVRYSILYFAFIPMPFVAMLLFMLAVGRGELDWLMLSLCMACGLFYAGGMVLVILAVLKHRRELPHGALSHTRIVSTLLLTEDMLSRVGQKPYQDPLWEDSMHNDEGPRLNE